MEKMFLIFIQIILIFKIVFSSKCTTIEMEDLKHTQNIQLNNFLPSHFGNTNVIKIQSKFKLENLFIFLSNDKFKYCILPYLSTQNFLKIYFHFQNFIPELYFQKFLPPSRFYDINNVLDIQEPTTCLQPLEIHSLYNFHGEYSSLKQPILNFTNNKIPKIFNSRIPIPRSSICGLVSQNKIVPYKTYVTGATPTSHQELLVLKEDEDEQFFVTFQKSKGQFINIARGKGVSEKEFYDYIDCIWEAYNLKGWKKYYWKFKSFFTVIYLRYLFYVVKIMVCLASNLLYLFETFLNHLEKLAPSHYFLVHICAYSFLCIFYVPGILMSAVVGYILFVLWYQASMLPFIILAIPLKHFVFGFNFHSWWSVTPSLASLYVCFFPQIKKCMPTSFGEIESIEPKNILPSILKSFEIEPNNIMSVVPLLVQNKKECWIECVNTYVMCFFIFGSWFGLSLLFLASGYYI